ADDLRALGPYVTALAGVGKLECGPAIAKPRQAATHVHPEFEAYVSLQGLIDAAAEVKRLEKLQSEKTRHLQGARSKLGNASFGERARGGGWQRQRDLVAAREKRGGGTEDNLGERGGE